MAKLSGIEIYKNLPRTNCGDCGLPTCMAFAMQVASKKQALDGCPHVSDEARAVLGDAQVPPMATLTLGSGDRVLTLGGETVMHRHEERFQHPPVLAVRISASLGDAEIGARLAAIDALQFERVGKTIGIDAIAIAADGVDASRFGNVAQKIAKAADHLILLLCEDAEVLAPAVAAIADRNPVLVAATEAHADAMTALAVQYGLPLVASAPGIDRTAALSERIAASGVKDIIVDPQPLNLAEAVGRLTQLRRRALEERVRSVGYPSFVDIGALVDNNLNSDARATAEMTAGLSLVMRYAGVLVLDTVEAWAIHPIVTARQDIYTDPQVPNEVEAVLYEIGKPGSDAPVLVTTNFALTYFTVAGEVANSKVPCYISVVDTEGMGVLNAYADDRLTVEKLVDVIREQGVMDRVSHNHLVIPGLVARMRMGIEEASGWDVIVGPDNASGIPHFLHELQPQLQAQAQANTEAAG
ncbi:acetyl-CoA decarbonylase/synthase complex subunit gamma [Candidatus Bipolaricaulota bacterium]|nr:acetyl-CoA decarbonylase/synthase complex subunit gamma [Candidatus Bipolaricaulota bacterium]